MSKEYEKITKQLESLMGHCGSMKGSEDADPVWEEDMQALQEAIDIIADYEKMSPQYGEMTVHFKIPQKPVRCGETALLSHAPSSYLRESWKF